MVVRNYDDLIVYQKAYQLALAIHTFSLELPKIEQYALASQIRRASKSICGNIAEGFGKQRLSSPEFKRFLGMVLGSADEMTVWLSFCKDLGYLTPKKYSEWKMEYVNIAKMLNGLRDKWH